MSEELKLSADGLEICAYEREWSSAGIEPYKERNANGRMVWPSKFKLLPLSKIKLRNDDVELCRLTDAQRLLSQLREELAQRDAEIERWKNDNRLERCDRYDSAAHAIGYPNVMLALNTLAALESQQAGSVGGEREAFEAWRLEKFCGGDERLKKCSNAPDVYYYTAEQESWKAWQARAALSPAGGVVVMPGRKRVDPYRYNPSVDGWNACLDEFARLNAKPQVVRCAECGEPTACGKILCEAHCYELPQANSQEGSK